MIKTAIHQSRVADQIQVALVNTHKDLVFNAKSHKAMAQAQSPDLATLQGFVNDCITIYLRNIKWVTDYLTANQTTLTPAITAKGWTVADITNLTTALNNAVNNLQSASKTSYTEISSACDTIINNINPPDSIWPE